MTMRRKRMLTGAAAAAIALGGTVAAADPGPTDPTEAQQTVTITVAEAPLEILLVGNPDPFELEFGEEAGSFSDPLAIEARNNSTSNFAKITVSADVNEALRDALGDLQLTVSYWGTAESGWDAPGVKPNNDPDEKLVVNKSTTLGKVSQVLISNIPPGADTINPKEGGNTSERDLYYELTGTATVAGSTSIEFTFTIEEGDAVGGGD